MMNNLYNWFVAPLSAIFKKKPTDTEDHEVTTQFEADIIKQKKALKKVTANLKRTDNLQQFEQSTTDQSDDDAELVSSILQKLRKHQEKRKLERVGELFRLKDDNKTCRRQSTVLLPDETISQSSGKCRNNLGRRLRVFPDNSTVSRKIFRRHSTSSLPETSTCSRKPNFERTGNCSLSEFDSGTETDISSSSDDKLNKSLPTNSLPIVRPHKTKKSKKSKKSKKAKRMAKNGLNNQQ